MKAIVLDQGLAPKVAEILNRAGWDALHVSTISLDRAQDEKILEYCERTGRVCVTLDHDFHQHLAISGSGRPSVVLLREEGLAASDQAALIVEVWGACEDAIDGGAAVSASRRSVRFKKLPLA